jgi:regulatory protein
MNSKILNYCLNILSKKDYTEYEIRTKLRKKFNNENIEDIIKYLKEYNYINDNRYTNNFIERKFKAGYGQYYIVKKLYEKGIKISYNDACNIINENNDIKIKVKELLSKKIIFEKHTDAIKLKKKCFDFLLRRGFDIGVINEVIQEVFKDESDFYQ